jgi:hypothetical protein
MSRMELAHTYQTEVGEVGIAVGVSLGQSFELLQMFTAIEGEDREPLTK